MYKLNMEMLGSAVGAEFCFGHDLAEFYYGFSFYVAAVTACKIPFVFVKGHITINSLLGYLLNR